MDPTAQKPAPALHVESSGTGPIVLLAHGFGGSARNFRPQVRRLASDFRVVTYDARGHARSRAVGFDDAPAGLDTLAGDLGSVLDRAGSATPAVVGGLSLGAATALAFALRAPARVRGLVLMSPPASGEHPGSLAARAADFAAVLEAEGLEAAGARFVWGPDSGLDARGAALVRQGFLEHDPVTLAAILRGAVAAWPAPDSRALGALRAPVLLVAGGEDPGSVASARELAGMLPDARLEIVPGAGHVVNLAAPALVGDLLRDWLDRLGGAPEIPSAP